MILINLLLYRQKKIKKINNRALMTRPRKIQIQMKKKVKYGQMN